MKKIEDIEFYTVEYIVYLQEHWDELMDRVENGETIGVENEEGERAVMLPADDEFIKIHTELNNDAD